MLPVFFRYVDTFVIWPHGVETLPIFLDHIKNIHPNIKFTIEIETNESRSIR